VNRVTFLTLQVSVLTRGGIQQLLFDASRRKCLQSSNVYLRYVSCSVKTESVTASDGHGS